MSTNPARLPKAGSLAQACDVCRAKKRRCDLKAGSQRCSGCERSNSVCQVTHVTKPREKRKTKQMETLEERLRSLEDLIKKSVATISQPTTTDQARMATPPSLQSTAASPRSLTVSTNVVAEIPSPLGFVRNNIAEVEFPIPSVPEPSHSILNQFDSSFAAPDLDAQGFWPQNHESQPIEIDSFPTTARTTTAMCPDLRPQVRWNDETGKRCSLPPEQGGLFLLQEYLVDYNVAVPIFDRAAITTLFRDCYEGKVKGKVIEWVALKVVLSIAHRLRSLSPLGVAQDAENAAIYVEECYGELPHMIAEEPSLLLAQCFVGLAVATSTHIKPRAPPMFLTMALRILQEVPASIQKNRVFWIAYFLEVDYSLRGGRPPPSLPDGNLPPLPPRDTIDGAGEIRVSGRESSFRVNVLRLNADLALIQADIAKKLQACKTNIRPSHEIVQYFSHVSKRLRDWRQNWLFELNVGDLPRLLHRSDLVHVFVLEATYFYTAYVVRTLVTVQTEDDLGTMSHGILRGFSKQAAELCHADARRFMNLLAVIPASDDAPACNLRWCTLEATMSAVCVILMMCATNPDDSASQTDLNSTKPVIQILNELADAGKDQDLKDSRNVCVELYNQAAMQLRERMLSRS